MPRRQAATSYATNVFLNCPFDRKYQPIFHAIVFTIIDCGYTVRRALEMEDTSRTRIDKIYKLIEECRLGVHDVSRIEQDAVSLLPRFNMPFELGLFLGARRFGGKTQQAKSCLVLEATRYTYQRFLSDIAGQDIRQHDNKPKQAAGAVRDWLASSRAEKEPVLPGATAIMKHYREFEDALPTMLQAIEVIARELEFFDRARLMGQFVKQRAEQITQQMPA